MIRYRLDNDDLPEGKKRCPMCDEWHHDQWAVCYDCKKLSGERGYANPYNDDPEEAGYNEYLREKALQPKSTTKKSGTSITDWYEAQKKLLNAKSAGLTEQHGKIWGKVFVNFSYQGVDFFGIKHFTDKGGAVEEVALCLGRYEGSDIYKEFPTKHENLSATKIVDGEYDHLSLVEAPHLKLKYGTPSILTSKLIQEVEGLKDEFIAKINRHGSINDLNQEFKFTGSYYELSGARYRSVLVINKNESTQEQFDAVAVMMNPGGSYPESGIYKKILSFTDEKAPITNPCSPDDTQYQLARLMKLQNWSRVLVLNLFDICDPNSKNVVERYSVKENLIESIFHEDRREELQYLLSNLAENAPIVIGWGVSEELSPIKKKILKFLHTLEHPIVGIQKEENQYYHPWPRDCQSDLRYNWAEIVSEQIKI